MVKNGDLKPGDIVSTEQYECRLKGRLLNTRGKEDPHKMYCRGTLFNDHDSSNIDVYHQVSLGDADTMRSKHLYEQHTDNIGVKFIKYRWNNGVYKSS